MVDTSLGKDLSEVEVMKSFREAGQFSKFGEEGMYMYVCMHSTFVHM